MSQNTLHAGVVSLEELAKSVAFTARLTDLQAMQAIQAISSIVVSEVLRDRAVQIDGFGLFDKGYRSNEEPALRFRQHNNVREALLHGVNSGTDFQMRTGG